MITAEPATSSALTVLTEAGSAPADLAAVHAQAAADEFPGKIIITTEHRPE
ncbi:hypothetical protein C8E87_4795 [Paractinoplanes brasiliensis]|uniref:Uncharacterized protein n=1 Tax=Paractinoplanes brasiliensis TaxID=52695 RepID=A0A4V3C8C0_9ACTN|nr:hypothetical protein C8E87_4795 [Actinoplanes brasiliensis]